MEQIVYDLQRKVLNPDIDAVSLLRHAHLVARKLKLSEFECWTKSELDGYDNVETIPLYRQIQGELKVWNPYHGWITVSISDTKLHEAFNRRMIKDSISSLASALKKADKGIFIPITGDELKAVSSMTNVPFVTKYVVFLSPNSLESIIETVKNKILDWAILLEENGIIGESLVFSNEEKERAVKSPQIINYVANFYGSIEGVQIQQGTVYSEQSK